MRECAFCDWVSRKCLQWTPFIRKQPYVLDLWARTLLQILCHCQAMCLNVVFGKHGCQKYLISSQEWLQGGICLLQTEDDIEGGVFQGDQGSHHFHQTLSNFGPWSPGGGSAGCLWHLAAFPELFYVLLSSERKNVLKRHNWGGAILHKVYVFRSVAPENALIEHTWSYTDHFKEYQSDRPLHVAVWLAWRDS